VYLMNGTEAKQATRWALEVRHGLPAPVMDVSDAIGMTERVPRVRLIYNSHARWMKRSPICEMQHDAGD
jgi:hypothetical protein